MKLRYSVSLTSADPPQELEGHGARSRAKMAYLTPQRQQVW
jgi:hypothetical protein